MDKKTWARRAEIMAQNYDWEELNKLLGMLWFMYDKLSLNVWDAWEFAAEAQDIRGRIDAQLRAKKELS